MYFGIHTHEHYSQVALVNGESNLQQESGNDWINKLAKHYTGAEAAIEAPGHYRPVYEIINGHLNLASYQPIKN